MLVRQTSKRVRLLKKRPKQADVQNQSLLTNEQNQAKLKWVSERIERIKKSHSIGAELLQTYSDHSPPGMMRALAAKYGIPEGAARRYRQIAKMFSQSELDALYDQFRAENFAFTVTHFFVLIGVNDRKARKKLAQAAMQKKLNITQLRKLKLRIEHSTGPGGRRPDVVNLQTQEDLHAAVHFEAGKWRRWLDHLLEEPRPIKPSLRKRLAELHSLVKKVQTLSGR